MVTFSSDAFDGGPQHALRSKRKGETSRPTSVNSGSQTRDARLAALQGSALPDDELVRRVAAGERALFEVLMRRHNARVYHAVRSILRDEAEVEDAMQQTYLLAYAHLPEFAGASSFVTWLTRIALHEALGRVRRPARLVPVGDAGLPEDTVTPPPDSPEDRAACSEAARYLERCIDRLPSTYRSVVMLREVDQLTTAETAEALGVTEEAVRIRLHRARLALRRSFAEDLARGAAEAFPFFAPRCDRVVARVLAALPRG
jgi:RNA polymerase sigma-70 factor, ECF subfamily